MEGPNRRRPWGSGRPLPKGTAIISPRASLRPPGHIPSDADCGDDLAREADADIEHGLRLDSRGEVERRTYTAIMAWPGNELARQLVLLACFTNEIGVIGKAAFEVGASAAVKRCAACQDPAG